MNVTSIAMDVSVKNSNLSLPSEGNSVEDALESQELDRRCPWASTGFPEQGWVGTGKGGGRIYSALTLSDLYAVPLASSWLYWLLRHENIPNRLVNRLPQRLQRPSR